MKHILGPQSYSTLTNVQSQDVQPNAVDLRIDKVFRLLPSIFILNEDNTKRHRDTMPVETQAIAIPPEYKGRECYYLNEGAYEVVFENTIKMSHSEAGWVVTRSTLIRNGVFIVSGLYDSGYHGSMAAALHVTSGPFIVEKSARIGQFVMFQAEALHAYNGSYGFDKDGRPKKDEEKYVSG